MHALAAVASIQAHWKYEAAYIKDLPASLLVGQITENAPAEASQHSFIQVLRPVSCSQHHDL